MVGLETRGRRTWELEASRGGVPVFAAGVTAPARDSPSSPRRRCPGRRDSTRLNGFVEVIDKYQRLDRVAYPEEVLVGRNLQQQGESLGRWVVETYAALYAAGPPPGLAAADGG